MKIIGVSGGSCSGKTHFSRLLAKNNSNIQVLSLDNYYHAYPNLPFEKRKLVDYDIPESLDIDKALSDINSLEKGVSIKQPVFSYKTLLNYPQTEITTPCDILIVEGIFALYYKELSDCIDLKVFVDTSHEIRMARRIKRDVEELNRPLSFVISQYLNRVVPMYEKYILPQKQHADFIVDGGKNYSLINKLFTSYFHEL